MEKRKGDCRNAPSRPALITPVFFFLFSLFFAFLVAGCGAPGEPSPPRQPVPTAVTDLTARQLGNGVLLTFTLPKKAVDGLALAEPPSVEIYRGTAPAGVKPSANAPRLVFTIPPAMLNDYTSAGHVEFRDPLPPENVSSAGGEALIYTVRTRASKKRASADSNPASVRVFPVLGPPALLRADVTETAMILTWSPPAGEIPTGAQSAGFHVYRAEIEPADVDAARLHPEQFKLSKPLDQIGAAQDAEFHDTQFEFGHAYFYVVRAVVRYSTVEVESADSRPVAIKPTDIFPPAPPANLVAIAVAAAGDAAAHIELSWSISGATDLAGYNVYRSEGDETSSRGERLNPELLLAPAFRDVTATPGRRCTYRVTSVDRTGNESATSAAVTIDFTPRTP
jgi:hypothetical protein